MGNALNARSPWKFPRFDAHIPLYKLKIHTSDDFPGVRMDDNRIIFTLSCEMCSFSRVDLELMT